MPADALAAFPDPVLLLAAALVIDGLLPDANALWRVLPHPVTAMAAPVAFLERKLNRPGRGPRALAARGAVVVLAVAGLAAAAGWAIHRAAAALPYGWLAELALVVVLLAQHSLFVHVRDVYRPLAAGDLAGARVQVARIVGRDPERLDRHGTARASIESLFENFSDGVVAPALFYLLLGLPGMLAYKAVNTMDSMIGHRDERYRWFGMVAARTDDALNLIPARLSALIVALAALVAPTARPWAALSTALREAGKHRSPNAGWPEAAAAGALGLALAGPRAYPGHVVNDPWIGGGRARAEAQDIRRALFLYAAACCVHAGLVAALAWARLAA